jgi:hypothetical protein
MSEPNLNHSIEPGQEYHLDLFRPEDAPGVVRLFRDVYGEHYPVETFINAERLILENAAGRTVSSVARTTRGDIVGHNAVFNSAPWQKTYESGAGLVHRDYRGGHGIFRDMVAHGQQVAAKKQGLAAIFGEPVCNHLYSQKMTHALGWRSFAMEVELMPAATYAKEGSAGGRVSAFLDFVTLKHRPHIIYLPPVYEEILKRIYDGFDDRRDFNDSLETVPPQTGTEIRTQIFQFAQVARMTVLEAGSDFGEVMEAEEAAARQQGVQVIQVWLKLTWPWVGQVVDELRAHGFFLGGPLPRWFDGDGLLMQKLSAAPDWEAPQVFSDRAQMIFQAVRHDWAEVTPGPQPDPATV